MNNMFSMSVSFTLPALKYEHPLYYEAIINGVTTAIMNVETSTTYSTDGLSDWISNFLNVFYEDIEWFVVESLYVDEINRASEVVWNILKELDTDLDNVYTVYFIDTVNGYNVSEDKFVTIIFTVRER